MKPKVFHVITKLELGGAQKVTLMTLERLSRDRYDVSLITNPDGLLVDWANRIPNLTRYWMPSLIREVRPLQDLRTLVALWKLFRRERPAVVHTHSSKAGILGRWAAWLAGVPNIFHTAHGFGFNDFQRPLVRNIYIWLEKITSRVATGTVELTSLGVKGTVEFVERAPNQSSVIINAPGLGVMQRTFDGRRAWLQDPVQGIIRFTGLGLEMMKEGAVFNKPVKLKELFPSAVLIGKEKLGGKDVYVLRLGFERWYFDAESGLLLRKGNMYYDDYREVDGVKLPFKLRDEVLPSAGIIYQLTEIKHNVKIDEAKFMTYPSCFSMP